MVPGTSTSKSPNDGVSFSSEYGITVADAEKLLRRADTCFVLFATAERASASEMFEIPKRIVRTELKRRSGAALLPCELVNSKTLMFGGVAALAFAARRRK